MSSEPHLSRCCPYLGDCTDITTAKGVPYKVGFAGNETTLTVFNVFIILGIISNLLILIHTIFIKMKIHSQIGKYITTISVIEIFISISWIINIKVFDDTKKITESCDICKNYAIVTTFLYLFSWFLLFVTNKQLRKLIANQLVINDKKETALTIITCAILAFVVSVLLAVTKVTGISVS